jgi:hypothetical protein
MLALTQKNAKHGGKGAGGGEEPRIRLRMVRGRVRMALPQRLRLHCLPM